MWVVLCHTCTQNILNIYQFYVNQKKAVSLDVTPMYNTKQLKAKSVQNG